MVNLNSRQIGIIVKYQRPAGVAQWRTNAITWAKKNTKGLAQAKKLKQIDDDYREVTEYFRLKQEA